jgi:hypothetical protein
LKKEKKRKKKVKRSGSLSQAKELPKAKENKIRKRQGSSYIYLCSE